jgi:nicotinate-nucleotide adenylyltransferase
VLPRPGALIDWPALDQALPGIQQKVALVEGPAINVSSTAIRKWIAAGRSVRYLVPEAVLAFIQAKRLYRPLAVEPRQSSRP